MMLKPCPFCGSTNIKAGDSLNDPTTVEFPFPVAFVECMSCKTAVGFIKFTKGKEKEREEAIDIAVGLWNHREADERTDTEEAGEWIHSESTFWSGGGYTRCSICGYGFSDAHYFEVEGFKYCPNCGKKMKVPTDHKHKGADDNG